MIGPGPFLCALAVWMSCLTAVRAQEAPDPLARQVAAGWAYGSFDEAVEQMEQRIGYKVSCPKDLEAFMQTIWMKQSTPGFPTANATVRAFLDQLCGVLTLKWQLGPEKGVITVEPAWKTSDPRTPAELVRAVWQPGDGTGLEKDPQWQTAFNALLSHEANYERAWKVRQKSSFQGLHIFNEGPSKPVLMQQVIDTEGARCLLIVTCQPIAMYPGHGSVSYYWFKPDGTLLGAGLMNTGHRCRLIETTIDNNFGANAGKTSELQMVLEMNLRDRFIARFVLGQTGLELTQFIDAHGEKTNIGLNVGQSLMEPDKQ